MSERQTLGKGKFAMYVTKLHAFTIVIALAGVEGACAAQSAHEKDSARTSLANEYKLAHN
jgi:hypothetical protein